MKNKDKPEQQQDKTAIVPASAPQQQAPTLLPSTLARAVSFATRSSSLALRVGTTIGSYSLNTARFTTLSSLELARGVLEGVLVRAGRDVSLLSQSDYAAADAETVLEKSLESLHHAVSQVVFWTSAGFQVTGTAMGTVSDVSSLLLGALDQILGSTDSSRAIASIITLVRREFSNPVTGTGDKVGVMDLMLALSALAYLQQQCRKSIEEERREYEEVIWDVVVLTDGERVDVDDNSLTGSHASNYDHLGPDRAMQRDDAAANMRSVSARTMPWHNGDGDEDVISRLTEQMSTSLSPGATVSISNSVSTTQTITVDVHGQKPSSIPSLPGAEVVETRSASAQEHQQGGDSYRIVYKIQRNKLRNNVLRIQEDSDVTLVDLDDEKELPTSPTIEDDSAAVSSPAPPRLHINKELSDTKETVKGEKKRGPPAGLRPIDIPKRGSRGTGPDSPRSPMSLEENMMALSSPESEATANQKKQRAPLSKPTTRTSAARPKDATSSKRLVAKKIAPEPKSGEKKPSLKQVLRGSGQSFSTVLNKDTGSSNENRDKPRPQWKTPGTSSSATALKPSSGKSKALAQHVARHSDPSSIPRSSSRTSYVSISERRRDSMVSQADAWAIDSAGDLRPTTPTIVRTEVSSHDTRGPSYGEPSPGLVPTHRAGHRRLTSRVPSLYSLATNDSQQSLVLASCYQKSAYSASDAMNTLRQAGAVEGTFPSRHLLQNISRYMRFSSACYGSSFLKVMGISTDIPSLRADDETHNDVRHFVHHTESGVVGNVLLASFIDQGGGSNAAGSTDSGVPLVHYISLDHDAKAVVLACRGTLGFEDVLADMTCEYDDLIWRNRAYKVHKGVHASAQRILYGGDGKVLATLQEALREFPGYGLILCGHSLGGAVASLLGVMLSEPNPHGTGFVTASEKHDAAAGGSDGKRRPDFQVPPGRRIHVFAYGPPGVMASSLNKLTRGLITTVVHGSDLVPHLSLGLLHDFQALASTFGSSSSHPTRSRLRTALLSALQSSLPLPHLTSPSSAAGDEHEAWVGPALASLRESLRSQKLMPPGEVFCIESTRVLRRDAFVVEGEAVGRPARRVVLKYVRDVKRRFGEVRFAGSMLVDHSPKGYEEALRRLRLGVVE